MCESVTAIAYPNIALIKYWGKADPVYNLPATASLSLTLDVFPTTTTVGPAHGDRDLIIFDGAMATGDIAVRIGDFLDMIRARAGTSRPLRVETVNAGPTGAGLASSSSGFAALAAAAAAACGLSTEASELSRLARRGSGSAARSVFGGLAVWPTGTDETSVAYPIDDVGLELSIVITMIDSGPKETPSRQGMATTARTSPYHSAWVESSARDFRAALDALSRNDFNALGEITEHNALAMHASMMATRPPILYFRPRTFEVLEEVRDMRRNGLPAYATIDAGPNVKVLCPTAQANSIADELRRRVPGLSVVVAHRGPPVEIRAHAAEVPMERQEATR